MNDTRAVGQELQDQVLAAARKGQQRVASTVKNVTATAQLIRPQLPSLPRPTLNTSALPTPAQIRERAPQLVAMLPSTEQLRAGAHEFAGQLLSVQRKVVEQVRSVTTPLAHQAAAVLAQVGQVAEKAAPRVAEISEDAGHRHGKAEHSTTGQGATGHGNAAHSSATAHHNGPSTAKPSTAKPGTAKPGTRKSSTKSAAK